MSTAKPSFAEWLWLAAAVLVGAALRFQNLAALAVEHHDEGVYAANLDCSADDLGEFPDRPFYAPPLWPLAIEWTLVAGQVVGSRPAWLPMLPGILAGVALAPSVWWIGRRWFGPAAGIAAAWLVATSEFHAFYSRTALTDAPLCLLWLWAVYWSWRALDSASSQAASLRLAVGAGVWTALAWWTKHNGWVPLAIAISGGLTATWLAPKAERRWPARLATLAVLLTTALALWSPVVWDCQKVGGYGAVAANHRGYLAPWSAWGGHLAWQGTNFAAYFGAISVFGLLTAAGAAWCSSRSKPLAAPPTLSPPPTSLPRAEHVSAPWLWFHVDTPRLAKLNAALTAALTAALLATFAATIGLAGWALGCWLAAALGAIGWGLLVHARGELSPKTVLAACLLSAWFLGMLLATPLYRPFPRLALPLWLAATLAMAWLMVLVLAPRRAGDSSAPAESSVGRVRSAFFALSCGLLGCGLVWLAPSRLAEDRTCLVGSADAIAELLRHEHPAGVVPAVMVYSEPALFCLLTERGVAASPRADLGFVDAPPPRPTYLVTGMFVDRDAGFQQAWRGAETRFQAVQAWDLHPSSLVLFDYGKPMDWNAKSAVRPLRLYRLKGT